MIFDEINCLICNKKLKITAIKCKCDNFFCKLHKNEKVHNCSFNYKLKHIENLEKNLPIIVAKKIENI